MPGVAISKNEFDTPALNNLLQKLPITHVQKKDEGLKVCWLQSVFSVIMFFSRFTSVRIGVICVLILCLKLTLLHFTAFSFLSVCFFS